MIIVGNKKKVFLPIIFWGIALSLSAHEKRSHNTFYSEELRTIAVKADITSISDTLSDGIYYGMIVYKKRPITIIVEGNEVKHIGYSIFSPQQREAFNPVFCNFIERYALLLKVPIERNRSNQEMMYQDKVIFRKGNFETLEELIGERDSTLRICYSGENNINYFTWNRKGDIVCELGFPSSYKLLLGMEMDELDARLKRDIINTPTPISDSIRVFSKEELVASITRDYYVKKGAYYYFVELNSDNYYQPVNQNDNEYRLMFNSQYLRQSLANVMTNSGLQNMFLLHIKQEVYGYKDSVYTVTLAQYVDFCIKSGCVPYFCVISENNKVLDCELIMRNEVMQYNHVMRMKVGIEEVKNRKGVIEARLDAYVPTHYFKNLFYELKQ